MQVTFLDLATSAAQFSFPSYLIGNGLIKSHGVVAEHKMELPFICTFCLPLSLSYSFYQSLSWCFEFYYRPARSAMLRTATSALLVTRTSGSYMTLTLSRVKILGSICQSVSGTASSSLKFLFLRSSSRFAESRPLLPFSMVGHSNIEDRLYGNVTFEQIGSCLLVTPTL